MALRIEVRRDQQTAADCYVGDHSRNQRELKWTYEVRKRNAIPRKVWMALRRHEREHAQFLADNRARAERVRKRVEVALSGFEGTDPKVTAQEIKYLEAQRYPIDLAEARNGHSVRSSLERNNGGIVIDGVTLTADYFTGSC